MLEDITLYEFNSLNDREKGEALWEYGVHVSDRKQNDFRMLLYQISNFYVEVKYNPAGNVIESLRSFSNSELLNPYIDEIDISGL